MRKRTPFKVTALAAAVATTTLLPISGNAYDTQVGDVNVQIDTTLSVGFGWRASDIDYEGVGTANAEAAGESKAHRHGTGSQDNSNLRYEKGETFSELSLFFILRHFFSALFSSGSRIGDLSRTYLGLSGAT